MYFSEFHQFFCSKKTQVMILLMSYLYHAKKITKIWLLQSNHMSHFLMSLTSEIPGEFMNVLGPNNNIIFMME